LGAAGVCTLATPGALTLTHGTAPGNRVVVAMASVQLFKPKPKVDKGILMLDCEMHLVRNQITLTYN